MKDKKILNGQEIIVNVRNLKIGGNNPKIFIGGPCSVESEKQIMTTAKHLKEIGVDILRGGVFKPRTSPYAFQGLEEEGLKMLRKAGDEFDLPIITELMDEKNLDLMLEYTDIIQIGSRNMYNYPLLKTLGGVDKPVLLKRGMSATIKEWVLAAEYLAAHGNKNIILCERGVRGFDNYTRNMLDLAAVPIMKRETGLPIIVDPSHGTGVKWLIPPMTKSSLAAGADGIMVEVHPNPCEALSDGDQSLTFEEYENLYKECGK
ncbi:MAG: 3-deoxy-7-phosphoheptulonate synthase [Anaeromicrobium sp.]|jgi:3-deoxy-7-phosphoheptulonate synthase|uniref:3-deoxy-7-phosphoheptulonate synthase n=1 Tax=Anaeromicrobium sp. TaxID=1929132 RepID=UPI0025FEEFFF|nr:3-deoxy-7-phosphoheptulonate synthase [Anaeromicrobium sp.]MCT4593778.1 3-deoxy-7-phosphoheptulonate synthase [Anaeromicrobium sp.]